MVHADNCLNCNKLLEQEDKFCANCGQPSNTHQRLTIVHIGHEILHAAVHADKGFFHLIRSMVLRPGASIKEYLAGKRRKYFSPFSFFFIILAVYVFSNSILRPFDSVARTSEFSTEKRSYPAQYKTEKQQKKFDKIQARVDTAMNFMNTKTNIVLCISTPFIAFIMFLLYRKKLFYAEQLVVMTFINGFLNLLSVLIFTPLMYLAKGTSMYMVLVMVMLVTHLVYLAIVYHDVLEMPSSFKGYVKATATAFAGLLGWMILSFTLISLYIMGGILF